LSTIDFNKKPAFGHNSEAKPLNNLVSDPLGICQSRPVHLGSSFSPASMTFESPYIRTSCTSMNSPKLGNPFAKEAKRQLMLVIGYLGHR
jgi:hypothetical protein